MSWEFSGTCRSNAGYRLENNMFSQWISALLSQPNRRKTRRRVQNVASETLEIRQLPAANLFVATSGNDVSGRGTIDAPYFTLSKALSVAETGDSVILRGGMYTGNVRVEDQNVTIRSFDNEWAVITTPINDPNQEWGIRFNPTASGGRLQRIEVTGGFFYGVKIDSEWTDVPSERIAAKGVVIEDCRIHSTGADCIKITPGCDDVIIRRNEIGRSGLRPVDPDDRNAEGIDNVNGDRMIVQHNYIHDTLTTGVYAKGGSIGTVIEANLIQRTGGAGILFGFRDTDEEWFDTAVNPEYFENIDGTIRNNIVVDTQYAGIGLYGAKNATVHNNTLVNVALTGNAGIFIDTSETYVGNNPNPLLVACRNVKIANNIVSLSATTDRYGFEIRTGGIDGTLQTTSNRYFHAGSLVQFRDRRTASDFEGGFAGWRQHIGGETGSSQGNPLLNDQFHLASGSPCIDAGNTTFAPAFDYDAGRRSGLADIGADEAGAGTSLRVPPAKTTIGTGVKAPLVPRVSFAVETSAGTESSASIHVIVNLSAPSLRTVSVEYAVSGGTAVVGSDFVLAAGTLTFAPGQTAARITLKVTNDALDENNETIRISLSNPLNAEIGNFPNHTRTIQDDDPAPRLQFISSSSRFDESAGNRTLSVRLSTASGKTVTVPYRVTTDTATSGRDYTLANGIQTFQPGQIQKSIALTIRNDQNDELDENFVVALATPTNATLGVQSTHLVTIADNDPAPSIGFSRAMTSVLENAGTALISVSLSVVSGKTVRVNYVVSSGTATRGGVDFTENNGTLTFRPGETTHAIPVKITNDTLRELGETVRVQLSSPSNASLASVSSHVLTIADDESLAEVPYVTYRLPDGHLYRINPEAGAQPVDLTVGLNQLSPGTDDESVTTSPNGRWLAVVTDRFGIGGGWPGLAVVRADLSAGEAVRINGEVVHPEGAVAIASSGNLVVFSWDQGPHTRDLWSATRSNGVWTVVLLTANSPYAFNSQPAISADGTRVLFDGSNQPFSTGSQAICEVRVDGTGFRNVVTSSHRPAGSTAGPIHHADYAPDGSIVFEAEWTGEQIWRLPIGASSPVRVSTANNDNSPCVLPDGRIVSLWLNRPGNTDGVHELTIRSANGTFLATLLPGFDVQDIGISCGG